MVNNQHPRKFSVPGRISHEKPEYGLAFPLPMQKHVDSLLFFFFVVSRVRFSCHFDKHWIRILGARRDID